MFSLDLVEIIEGRVDVRFCAWNKGSILLGCLAQPFKSFVWFGSGVLNALGELLELSFAGAGGIDN